MTATVHTEAAMAQALARVPSTHHQIGSQTVGQIMGARIRTVGGHRGRSHEVDALDLEFGDHGVWALAVWKVDDKWQAARRFFPWGSILHIDVTDTTDNPGGPR